MSPEPKQRVMPKGGRKGGTIFPKILLDDIVPLAKRLVSKTHVSRQTRDMLMAGVVQTKGSNADVKISAMKQYGFLEGDNKNLYAATELAKKVSHADADELQTHLQEAMMQPKVFKLLFDTYHSDTISRVKLKQRAADLKVHPDETATCIDIYVAGMVKAGLIIVDGDKISHQISANIENIKVETESSENGDAATSANLKIPDEEIDVEQTQARSEAEGLNNLQHTTEFPSSKPKAIFNVNITLDSSMDIEKLSKQLELLRHYGAL